MRKFRIVVSLFLSLFDCKMWVFEVIFCDFFLFFFLYELFFLLFLLENIFVFCENGIDELLLFFFNIGFLFCILFWVCFGILFCFFFFFIEREYVFIGFLNIIGFMFLFLLLLLINSLFFFFNFGRFLGDFGWICFFWVLFIVVIVGFFNLVEVFWFELLFVGSFFLRILFLFKLKENLFIVLFLIFILLNVIWNGLFFFIRVKDVFFYFVFFVLMGIGGVVLLFRILLKVRLAVVFLLVYLL